MKVSICAIIKNEQLFLKEWIDWHLSIGFDSIFLCEDVGSIPHDEIVKEYDNVTLIQFRDDFTKYGAKGGAKRQLNLYRYFLEKNPENCDWCAFIDVDEFIHIDEGKNIKELLSEFKQYEGLYLYWKFYGADGNIYHSKGLVQENYTKETDFNSDNGWRFKSIVNMRKGRKMNSVHCVTNGVNTHGLPSSRFRTFHKGHIKHYFTKSWEDWITRFISRGDVHAGHRKLHQFFDLNPDMLSQKEHLMKIYEETIAHREQTAR